MKTSGIGVDVPLQVHRGELLQWQGEYHLAQNLLWGGRKRFSQLGEPEPVV